MKRLTSLLVLFVLLGMAPAAWAGPREEVAQSIRQWLQAHREGNAEALAALYADDAVFFSAHIPFRVDGKGAIRRHWAAYFKEFPTRRGAVHQLSRKIYGDSTAVSALYSVSTLVDRKGRTKTLHLRYTATRVKLGGTWLVVSTHVSRLPAPHSWAESLKRPGWRAAVLPGPAPPLGGMRGRILHPVPHFFLTG